MLSLLTADRRCVGGNLKRELYCKKGGKGSKRKPEQDRKYE